MKNYEIIFPENYVKPVLPGRNKWLAALRSNEYLQGQDTLKAGNRFCCLGVACDIENRLSFDGERWRDAGGSYCSLSEDHPLYPYIGSAGNFPKGVLVKGNGEEADCLIDLNDSLGLSFCDISCIMEEIWSEEGAQNLHFTPI